MYVYSDFQTYTGGVYRRTKEGVIIGGHTLKIIGWGVANISLATSIEQSDVRNQPTNGTGHAVEYWLVANSWGEDWGEKGFARIRRGVNECGIETTIAAGLVDESADV